MGKLELAVIAMMVVSAVISSASTVSAWGVAYGQKQIELDAGDTYRIRTSLQNMVSDETITVFIKLEGDKEIAELSETEVDLPPQTRSHPVYITVTIPDNPEGRYMVKAVYTQSANGGVMVDMATQKVLTFTINTNKEEPKPPSESPQTDDGDSSSSSTDWTPTADDEDEDTAEDKDNTPDETNQESNQPKLVENMPREKLNDTINQPEPQIEESGGWIMWLIGILAVIGIIGYLWWDGWI